MLRSYRTRAWMLEDGWTFSQDRWEGRGKGRPLEVYEALEHLRDRYVYSEL